jgi:hypothetical protein
VKNLYVPNSIYNLIQNITINDTGFNVTANNISVNLNGYTIRGVNDYTKPNYAFNGIDVNNIEIHNGTIKNFGDCFESTCNGYAIYLDNNQYSTIHDIEFRSNNVEDVALLNCDMLNVYNLNMSGGQSFIGLSSTISSNFYNISGSDGNSTLFALQNSCIGNTFSNISGVNKTIWLNGATHNQFTNVNIENYSVNGTETNYFNGLRFENSEGSIDAEIIDDIAGGLYFGTGNNIEMSNNKNFTKVPFKKEKSGSFTLRNPDIVEQIIEKQERRMQKLKTMITTIQRRGGMK